MMRTEDDARLSLDDTFTSESPSPEKVSEKSDPPNKSFLSPVRLIKDLLNPWHPFRPPATWESVSTSWMIPDSIYYLFRLCSVTTCLSLLVLLWIRRHLDILGYLPFILASLAGLLLVIPIVLLVIVGPLQDCLDSAPLPYLWSFIAFLHTLITPFIALVLSMYVIALRSMLSVLHLLPFILFIADCLVNRIQPRPLSLLFSSVVFGIYVYSNCPGTPLLQELGDSSYGAIVCLTHGVICILYLLGSKARDHACS